MARLQILYLPDDKFAVVVDDLTPEQFDKANASIHSVYDLKDNLGAEAVVLFPFEVEVLR